MAGLVLLPGVTCDAGLWQKMEAGLAPYGPLIYGDLSQGRSVEEMAESVSGACLTLVIHAAEDRMRTYQEAQILYDAIPRATLVTIRHSGHRVPLEQPQALLDVMTRWLSSPSV